MANRDQPAGRSTPSFPPPRGEDRASALGPWQVLFGSRPAMSDFEARKGVGVIRQLTEDSATFGEDGEGRSRTIRWLTFGRLRP